MLTVDGVIVGGFAMLMLGDPTLRYIGFSSLCICTCATFIWLVILGIMTLTAAALMLLKVAHQIEKVATYLMTMARTDYIHGSSKKISFHPFFCVGKVPNCGIIHFVSD